MKTKFLVLVCAIVGSVSTGQARADDWNWLVAPYLWAPSVGIDLTVSDEPTLGAEVPFKDLVSKLDIGFMGRFEGRKGNWGVFLDTVYLDLSDESTTSLGPGGPIIGDLGTEANLKLKLYDAGGFYRFADFHNGLKFDLLGGVRYIDQDLNAAVLPSGNLDKQVDIGTGLSETDLLLGARLIGDFSPDWHWKVWADYSFGGTEGTFNALAAVGYSFGERDQFLLDIGYRHMNIKLDGDTRAGASTETEMSMSGPIVGLIIGF